MSIKQLSVLLENKPGSLCEVTKLLYEGGINIRALTVADTNDFGILRIITDDQSKAAKILSDDQHIVAVTDVVVASMNDVPGSISNIFKVLSEADITVEYTYAFLSDKTHIDSAVVLRVDDNEKAEKVLHDAGISLADDEIFK